MSLVKSFKLKIFYTAYSVLEWVIRMCPDDLIWVYRLLILSLCCVLEQARHINPSLLLVQLSKPRPFITERLLMGRKESNQTNTGPCLF